MRTTPRRNVVDLLQLDEHYRNLALSIYSNIGRSNFNLTPPLGGLGVDITTTTQEYGVSTLQPLLTRTPRQEMDLRHRK